MINAIRAAIFLIAAALPALLCGPAHAASPHPAPLRIVSLYPGHTDNIVALGAGDRLVAASRDDGPAFLPFLPGSPGSPGSPDLPRLPPRVDAEAVLAFRPDAVFLRSLVERMNPHLTEVLERAGVAVHVIDPPSWDEFEGYLTRLAGILGTDPEEARRRLAAARGAVADAAKTAAVRGMRAPRVFLEATSKELHTCAPDSWAARLIRLSGGVNAASSATPLREGSALASWGVERVLATAESLDVYLVQQGPMNAASPEEIRSRPWGAVLKNVSLAAVPERLLSRPSLLGLEKGGALLTEIFGSAASSAGPGSE
ncbi:MAG: ABC transporter substrate-binding protein [Synergistaceae bacterium]|jgi:iron complex transport system substrate-binding protein|nr:ABC transporter substrate-binding protein [Synergistaceae bacterium]